MASEIAKRSTCELPKYVIENAPRSQERQLHLRITPYCTKFHGFGDGKGTITLGGRVQAQISRNRAMLGFNVSLAFVNLSTLGVDVRKTDASCQ
jgi:hypothetical protein